MCPEWFRCHPKRSSGWSLAAHLARKLVFLLFAARFSEPSGDFQEMLVCSTFST
jgi:hypothetical protein